MQDDSVPQLRDLVRQHRNRAGFTQESLGRLAGISESMVAHVESGKRAPSVDTVNALARALGLSSAETARLQELRVVASAEQSSVVSPKRQAELGAAVEQLKAQVAVSLQGPLADLTVRVATLESQMLELAQRVEQVVRLAPEAQHQSDGTAQG